MTDRHLKRKSAARLAGDMLETSVRNSTIGHFKLFEFDIYAEYDTFLTFLPVLIAERIFKMVKAVRVVKLAEIRNVSVYTNMRVQLILWLKRACKCVTYCPNIQK